MELQAAIDVLVNAYGDLDTIARGLPVDAAELYSTKVDDDTAEAVAIAYLKKYTPQNITPKKKDGSQNTI